MGLKERLPRILAIYREDLDQLRENAADSEKDRDGSSSSSVEGALRGIGIASYVAEGDSDTFRRCLSESAQIRLRMFQRRQAGEPIDHSFVAMLAYKRLFDALAAGDFITADNLAACMGGRPEIEEEHDHPFDRCLGYTLRAFVLQRAGEMAERTAAFEEMCRGRPDFAGYATVFRAIRERSSHVAQQGLEAIVKGHENQSKRGGVFNGIVDEVLCVWGIGIANLALRQGLNVTGVPPLIPDDLLRGA